MQVIKVNSENIEEVSNRLYLDSVSRRISEGTNIDKCEITGYFLRVFNLFSIMFYAPYKSEDPNSEGLAFGLHIDRNITGKDRLICWHSKGGVEEINKEGNANNPLIISELQKLKAKDIINILVPEVDNFKSACKEIKEKGCFKVNLQ